MKPKLGLLAAAAVTVLSVGCSIQSGSGKVVTQQIDASPFSAVEVSDSFSVHISVGETEAVMVRVDDNLVDAIDVQVSDQVLHLGVDAGTEVIGGTLEANITVQGLDRIEGSGDSTIELVDPVTADDLAIVMSGTTQLAGPVQLGSGTLELSGVAAAELSGSAAEVGMTGSGARRLHAPALVIDDLTIDLSGSSRAEVNVTGALSAGASGASQITYAGSPALKRCEVSGAASIGPAD